MLEAQCIAFAQQAVAALMHARRGDGRRHFICAYCCQFFAIEPLLVVDFFNGTTAHLHVCPACFDTRHRQRLEAAVRAASQLYDALSSPSSSSSPPVPTVLPFSE